MDKSIDEKHLSQPLQTHKKQFKLALTFLTAYNGLFKVTNKNSKFYFTVSINDDDFNQITIPPGAYEIERLNNEIKRNITEECYFTEATYPLTIKPNLSTLGSVIKSLSNNNGSQIAFTPDDSISDLLGFKTKYYTKNVFYQIIRLIFYHLIILSSKVILLNSKFSKAKEVVSFITGK